MAISWNNYPKNPLKGKKGGEAQKAKTALQALVHLIDVVPAEDFNFRRQFPKLGPQMLQKLAQNKNANIRIFSLAERVWWAVLEVRPGRVEALLNHGLLDRDKRVRTFVYKLLEQDPLRNGLVIPGSTLVALNDLVLGRYDIKLSAEEVEQMKRIVQKSQGQSEV